jgi:hypothetical protein
MESNVPVVLKEWIKPGQMLVLSVKRMNWKESFSRYGQHALECGCSGADIPVYR